MCSNSCPCVVVDKSKWDGVVDFEKNRLRYNFNGNYETFGDCYEDKEFVINTIDPKS